MASHWIREAARSPELSASSPRASGNSSSRGKRPYTPLFLDVDDGTEFGAATSTPRPFHLQGGVRRGAASTSKKPHAVQTTLHRHMGKQTQSQKTPSRMPLGERSSNVLVAYGATPSQKQQKKPQSAESRVKPSSISNSRRVVRDHDRSSCFGHPSPSLLRSDTPSPSQLDLRNVFGPAPPSSLVGRGNSPLVARGRPDNRPREERSRGKGPSESIVDLSRSSEDEEESRREDGLDDGKSSVMSPPQLPSIRSPRSKRRIYALETQVSSSQDLKEEMMQGDGVVEDEEESSPLSSPPPETPSKQKVSPRPKPSQASSTTEPGASFQSDGSRRNDRKRSTEERPQVMDTDLVASPRRQSRSPELCSSEEDTLPFFDETYHDPGSDDDDVVLSGEPSRHQPPRSAKKTATEQQQQPAHQESPNCRDEREEEKEEEEAEESETQLLPWEGEDYCEERNKKRPSAWMEIEKGWSGVDLSAKAHSTTAGAAAASQTRASQTAASSNAAEQGLLDRYGFTQHRQKRRRAPLLDDEASQRYEVEEEEHFPKQPPSSGQSKTQDEEQTNEDDDVVPSIIPDMADLDTQARRWLFQEDF